MPVKVSVGAGPVNLAWHAYFNHYKDAKELSYALAPIFNAEMKELVAAGAKYLQIEDLGAWMPLFTGDKAYYTWIKDVIAQCCDGVNAKIGWHFCFGNAWGNDLISGAFPEGYQTVLPHFFDTPGINEFVLDYANRNMAGVEFLKNLPKDKSVQVGVLDVRSNAIESPQTIAARIKKVVAAVSPRSRRAEHRLRHEAAGAHGREDEAQFARRGCEPGPQRSRWRVRSHQSIPNSQRPLPTRRTIWESGIGGWELASYFFTALVHRKIPEK